MKDLTKPKSQSFLMSPLTLFFFHWERIPTEFLVSSFDSEIGLMLDFPPKAEEE